MAPSIRQPCRDLSTITCPLEVASAQQPDPRRDRRHMANTSPTFIQPYRDFLRTELKVQASQTARQSREYLQTFVSYCSTSSLPIRFQQAMSEKGLFLCGTMLNSSLLNEHRYCPRCLRCFLLPLVESKELTGGEKVVTDMGSVDHIRLRHFYEQS